MSQVTVQNSNAGAKRRAHAPFAMIACLLVAIATVLACALIGGNSYIVGSIIVVICAMLPFFITFERRRVDVQRLVLIAVMSTLAIVSRALFVAVPFFKPMAGIVMISGMALGPVPGFMVGSISMFASNFIFGQGPWTLWQMLSFGLCGAVFGLMANRAFMGAGHLSWKRLLGVSVLAGLFYILVAGPILDTSTIFFMLSRITPEGVLAVYLAGFPINCISGISTAITVGLLANPLLWRVRLVC